MKKTFRKMIVLFPFLILCLHCGYAAQENEQTDPSRFQEHVITVDMVVNDVLFAGFSSKRIDSFQPVIDDIDETHIPKFKESGKLYVTTSFYVYGIASSKHVVTVELDFGGRSKIDSSQPSGPAIARVENTNKGLMYSFPLHGEPANEKVPELPVYLMGNDVTGQAASPVDAALYPLPLRFVVNPKKGRSSGNVTVNGDVSTGLICSDMLWLQLAKEELDGFPGVDGNYRTELVLTLSVV